MVFPKGRLQPRSSKSSTHQHGARGVHDVAARLALGVHQVDGSQQKLLLQKCALPDLGGAFG